MKRILPLLLTLVCAVTGFARAQSAGWSVTIPGSILSSTFALAWTVDELGTTHAFFRHWQWHNNLYGAWVVHAYKTAASASWSTHRVVSAEPLDPLFLPPRAHVLADRAGRVHLWWAEKPAAGGGRKVWYGSVSSTNPAAPPTIGTIVSNITQPATIERVILDSNRRPHLFYSGIPNGQNASMLHHRVLSGTSWSGTTVLRANANSVNIVNLPPNSILADPNGAIHCFFEQQPSGATLPRIYQGRIGATGSWQIKQVASSTVVAPAFLRAVIDTNLVPHVIYEDVPSGGAVQLFHTFDKPGFGWTTAVMISTPGAPLAGTQLIAGNFFLESAGLLHCWFEQVSGVRQVWYTTTPVANPGTWTTPANCTNSSVPTEGERALVDRNGIPHLIFSIGAGTTTTKRFLRHSHRLTATAWLTTPLNLTPQNSQAITIAPRMFHFGVDGRIHAMFEQPTPTGGVTQVWHTSFATSPLAQSWTTAAALTPTNQNSVLYSAHVDQNGNPHLFYTTPPAAFPTFATKLFHRYGTGTSWSGATQLGVGNGTGFNAWVQLLPGVTFNPERAGNTVQFAPNGDLHTFFSLDRPSPIFDTFWHGKWALDRTDLAITAFSAASSTPTRGTAVSVTGTVSNQGNKFAPTSTVTYYLTSHGNAPSPLDDFVLGSDIVPALNPNQTHALSRQVVIPAEICAGRSWTLHAFVDPMGVIAETNEANNRVTTALTPAWPTAIGYYNGKLKRTVLSADANDQFGVCSRRVGAVPAGTQYLFVWGVTGTSPGTPLAPGVTLPLNWDASTDFGLTLFGTTFVNMLAAQTTAVGGDNGHVKGGAWLASGLGLDVYLAAAYLDGGGTILDASVNPVTMRIR